MKELKEIIGAILALPSVSFTQDDYELLSSFFANLEAIDEAADRFKNEHQLKYLSSWWDICEQLSNLNSKLNNLWQTLTNQELIPGDKLVPLMIELLSVYDESALSKVYSATEAACKIQRHDSSGIMWVLLASAIFAKQQKILTPPSEMPDIYLVIDEITRLELLESRQKECQDYRNYLIHLFEIELNRDFFLQLHYGKKTTAALPALMQTIYQEMHFSRYESLFSKRSKLIEIIKKFHFVDAMYQDLLAPNKSSKEKLFDYSTKAADYINQQNLSLPQPTPKPMNSFSDFFSFTHLYQAEVVPPAEQNFLKSLSFFAKKEEKDVAPAIVNDKLEPI